MIISAIGQTIDAEFADLLTFKLWALVNRPAILLGGDVLRRFETVCLDFSRDEVRFRLPRSGWG